MRFRANLFLKDVATLAITAFGGPQAHIGLFQELLVNKRRYLTEAELMEMHALCQILPGPSSTQTITAVAFRFGGARLAYLTLVIWLAPALTILTLAGVLANYINAKDLNADFARFMQPIAVGFVIFAAYNIIEKVIHSRTGGFLLVLSALVSFYIRSPYMLPVLVIMGGIVSARKYKKLEKEEKVPMHIPWANFLLWGGFFIVIALLGSITQYLPIKLFENFYRNGSLIFGGGQVLIPAMFTEFVVFKEYLTTEEFLTGYSIAQLTPGPVFSFSSYISTLSLREYGIAGQLLGGILCGSAIFLPGTFLIFFVIRFWDELKRYRVVKASLEGIQASSAGLVVSAAILLFEPIEVDFLSIAFLIGTVATLMLTKVPTPIIVFVGLVLGWLIPV
jgi:chromate transporter